MIARSHIHHKTGFTLVEAIVSAALMAIAIAGSYKMIVLSSGVMQSARNHYIAINLGKNRIERARTMAYRDLPLLTESNLQVNANGVPAAAGDFRRTTIVNTNGFPGLTDVTVNTEMRSSRTQRFGGEVESVSAIFTEYLEFTDGGAK